MARLKAGMPPATEEMLRWLSMLGRRPKPAVGSGGDAVPDAGGEAVLEPASAANGDTACCAAGSDGAVACRCGLAAVVGDSGLRVSCRTIAKYSLRESNVGGPGDSCWHMQKGSAPTDMHQGSRRAPLLDLVHQASQSSSASLKLTWALAPRPQPPL